MPRTLAPRPLLLATVLALCASAALAQTTPQPGAPAPADATEPRIERIQHEDALTRVDELRVAGQTRSITVQPKNGAPAYEIAPQSGAETPAEGQGGSSGRSRWRVLSF